MADEKTNEQSETEDVVTDEPSSAGADDAVEAAAGSENVEVPENVEEVVAADAPADRADAVADAEPAAAEPAADEATTEADASGEDATAAKKKRKRLPRSKRPQKTRPARQPSATRKPIVRLEKPASERGRRQERQGTVVSDAMDKTIVVEVDMIKAHPKYKKVVRRSTKFHAHDEGNEAKLGDIVRIVETRPLSKSKRWRLTEVVEVAK
jgi:small subunit ribosomal protein S17